MDLKKSTANLMQRLQDAEVAVDSDVHNGGIERTAENLSSVEIEVVSPCRNVIVVVSANGALVDVVIKDGAIGSLSAYQMGSVITETVSHAEQTVSNATELYIQRTLSRRATEDAIPSEPSQASRDHDAMSVFYERVRQASQAAEEIVVSGTSPDGGVYIEIFARKLQKVQIDDDKYQTYDEDVLGDILAIGITSMKLEFARKQREHIFSYLHRDGEKIQ